MNRKKILEIIKGLDESGVCPYLHGVLTDGSAMSENWMEEIEERKPSNESELINILIDLNLA